MVSNRFNIPENEIMSPAININSVKPKLITGLYGGAQAWAISKLLQTTSKLFIICANSNKAEELMNDLTFFNSQKEYLGLPSWDTLPFEPVSPLTIITAQRLHSFKAITSNPNSVTIVSIQALMQKVCNLDIFESLSFTIKNGQQLLKSEIESRLIDCGYQQSSIVEEVGDLAIRGNVIDFYPATSKFPVRLEISTDRLERLTYFDPQTQRSTASCDYLLVTAVKEQIPKSYLHQDREELNLGIKQIKQRGRELGVPPRDIVKAVMAWRTHTEYPGLELIHAIARSADYTVFDYLQHDTEILFQNHSQCFQAAEDYWQNIVEREAHLNELQQLFPNKERHFVSPLELTQKIERRICHNLDDLELASEGSQYQTINFNTISNASLTLKFQAKAGTGKTSQQLRASIETLRRANNRIGFVVGSNSRAERLQQILLSCGLEAKIYDSTAEAWVSKHDTHPLVIMLGHLSSGFQLPQEKLVFIAENELFAEKSYRKTSCARASLKKLMNSLAQLAEDDYVVHVDYGIGLYRGLRHLNIEGTEGDFLHIDYADSRLYLPVQNIGKIQKFSAAEGQLPILDKLGASTWTKTKNKVRESVITLAGDLIKLYATRSVAKGWRFEPRGAEDERFADGFPYDETPDQRKSIEEVLADMAQDKPMDRLVCGDVGFGKTEVAIRAAFKCTQHTRQVAVLVPTTILVEQHFNNFANRFVGYPVKIGAISRFYSATENKRTLDDLAKGDLDIIIGTHRLLSRDVHFKDLGLVIIDEEHRFGVKQKELLKQLKKQVDVLTLTATPIPRTLHMSLLSIRDISIISTPPNDRRVIRTYVAENNDSLIRDTIFRELQRGGQCFVIHNRIQGIDIFTAGLAKLVPEAKFEFAHGQMNENQLEEIMQRFLNKQTDVLVSTTIVESGLDIPNANTIIIDRADTFGLAQLYQLRGRVGRSTKQAYAYLMIPHLRKLGSDAQKRLKVLQSLDDLGLGFNLAVRDLEIRGAGNLLGKEQSGSVLAVGYELYSKILKEAVLNLKGEELSLEESIDPEVKIGSNAYIPDYYIPDVPERLVLYQRLASLQSDLEARDLELEIADRFGPMPVEVSNLVELMRLRSFLKKCGVVKAELTGQRLVVCFSPRTPIDSQKLAHLVQTQPEVYRLSKNMNLTISLQKETAERRERVILYLYGLFEKLTAVNHA